MMNLEEGYTLARQKAKGFGPKGERITRDAFLYMEPDGASKDFAQCDTCAFFANNNACSLMALRRVAKEGTCAAYIHRRYRPIQTVVARLSPETLGYTERKVRCENCKYGGQECALYAVLNKKMPEVFNLKVEIKPKACCNANTPKE